MKEDKENARPKERRGAATGLGTLLGAGSGTGTAAAGDSRTGTAELDRLERPKDKKETLSKVVIRRLPPSLTKEQLEEHLQPLPEHDYFEFFANDSSLYPHMFSRAYINFKNQEDIVLFRDRFDGYVFVDHKGQEYAAIVEFAPFQKAAKKKSKKKDAKTGTIEDDPEYKKFLESYSADDEKLTSTPETLLEEIEARNKELIAKKTTPLLNFLKNKQRLREEKREERRRRELERKRQREEERRKWKEEERRKRKEAEKLKKLLKKPEKDEKDLERKEKSKKLEKETLREEKIASSASAKRSDGETKEEKAKKSEDECVKDYRDRDRDYERDREYERAQREKLRRQEEERRRQKERFEKEKVFRRKEEEVKKERDLLREKGKKSDLTDFTSSTDKSDKVTKDDKKEDTIKRDRIRNKDRPAMQLYQPGARSRSRLCQYEDSAAKPADQGADKKQESETSNMKEEE
ncbi:regulator of nonsense transcripts 3B isoform X2 [Neopsephotus bourkii]|uniref:regulator of nonsense transcripts 3B isoform X2 n=1 Tax=Neopsephotus bourkii TaxID=309878 RepID=UPI002AA4FFB0|nr:regulator of nonsense transcripts 3B isoform X2 [Neopsephotus bourkii]